jgi:hypothetical protein
MISQKQENKNDINLNNMQNSNIKGKDKLNQFSQNKEI